MAVEKIIDLLINDKNISDEFKRGLMSSGRNAKRNS